MSKICVITLLGLLLGNIYWLEVLKEKILKMILAASYSITSFFEVMQSRCLWYFGSYFRGLWQLYTYYINSVHIYTEAYKIST